MDSKNIANIVIIIDSFGFPYGMASTSRVRLIARGLVEKNICITVLCVIATEKEGGVENIVKKGSFMGIDFEYTAGTTIRSKNFWARRYYDIKGLIVAIYRLIDFKRKGELDNIYYYGNIGHRRLYRWLFYMTANLLNTPLIIEICERPWLLEKRSVLDSYLHPLKSVNGAITISSYLTNWAISESKKRGTKIRTLELPILVDVDEHQPLQKLNFESQLTVVFAGSSKYDETLRFILDSMKVVWQRFPNCQLVITGNRTKDPSIDWLINYLDNHSIHDKVNIAGYLTRADLLHLYQSASALLIPLFDDIRSHARFPTKIGEYLCSCTPVVTTRVGEISRYFTDNENSFICDPGDSQLYGNKIMEAIDPSNQKFTRQIGQKGREIAEIQFNYKNHRQSLVNFFTSFSS